MHVCVNLIIYLSIYLSIYLFIYLFIYLSIYQPHILTINHDNILGGITMYAQARAHLYTYYVDIDMDKTRE